MYSRWLSLTHFIVASYLDPFNLLIQSESYVSCHVISDGSHEPGTDIREFLLS